MLAMRDETYDSESKRAARRTPAFALFALLLLGACAQPPDVDDFLQFELEDSSVVVPPGMDAGPPGGPGAGGDSSVPIIPPIIVPDGGSTGGLDASVPPRMDAGREAGVSNPPQPDASRPADAAADVVVITPPRDSGPETGPVQGNTCSTTPAYPTPDACSKCICERCASQVANCYASNEPAKNDQCKAVRTCAQTSNCTSTACYCGASPTCLFPDGPCMQVIETAVGSTNLLDIQAAGDDPNSPVGRSNLVGMCEMSSCAAECGL
jgi:hypothetical protein